MASYNIKHIEYLRQKANLTYEQAVALLDRNDGDIGRALIELEKSGALRGENQSRTAPPRSEPQPQPEACQKSFWDNAVDLFIKGLRIKLVIEKDRDTLVRLPVIYLAVGVFMAPYFAILSVVLMFLTGCRVHIEKYNNPEGDRKIRSYARGAERTVRNTINGASRTPYNAPKGDKPSDNSNNNDTDGDDFDSFTVE